MGGAFLGNYSLYRGRHDHGGDIAHDPRQVARRSRFAWTLSIVVLAVCFGFIGLVACDTPLVGTSTHRVVADDPAP